MAWIDWICSGVSGCLLWKQVQHHGLVYSHAVQVVKRIYLIPINLEFFQRSLNGRESGKTTHQILVLFRSGLYVGTQYCYREVNCLLTKVFHL